MRIFLCIFFIIHLCVYVCVSPGDGIERGSRGLATRHHTTMLLDRKRVFSASVRACGFGVGSMALFSTIFYFGGWGVNQKVASSTSGVWPAGLDRQLAVVVPMFEGDVDESFDAMRLWPTKCSPLTLRHTDLVIYHADAADELALLRSVPKAASTCFRHTKVVNAHLAAEVGCVAKFQFAVP